MRLGEDLTLGTVAITARVIGVVLESAALIPRCPSMLAQLCNDPVPVKVIADEHQFRHGPVCMGVRMHVAMMECRAGVHLAMSVILRAVMLALLCHFHSIGNTAPDTLHQQVPCHIAHMGEALDAQHWFLRCDDVERLMEGVWSLGRLAAQHKREPTRIFFVYMLVRHQTVLMGAEARMLVSIAVGILICSGRHAGARRLGTKLVEV